MYKAITLIEILATMVVMVIAIYFISPAIFTLQDRIALNSEVANIQSFIYQLQTKARYTKRNYTITISQNDQNWCMVAVRKPINNTKQIICDCLNKQFCRLEDEYHIYTPTYPNIKLINKSLYPKSFMNIDGISGRLESKCILMSLNKENDVLQIETLGRVYVAERDKRSTCKD